MAPPAESMRSMKRAVILGLRSWLQHLDPVHVLSSSYYYDVLYAYYYELVE